ncbi:hypothetical protein [Sphingomonas jatrophae]|uniref:hypothetical protein n=1 Tax=Sphingomonas jatrophae TaxID=1166337 RepID=UPI0010423185|nr:hypothetical protein [Sphingomonas jatrophae]
MSRKNGSTRDVRRMKALESAAEIVGGQPALAAAIGIGTRALRAKIAAERPISDAELVAARTAVRAAAERATQLADRIGGLLPGAGA